MSRKGMAMAAVAGAILILSVLLILLFFLFKSYTKASSLAGDSECQSSIVAHATMIKLTTEDVVPEITCPTKYYTIISADKDKIQNYLAESLKSCWGTWGRGELEFFKKEGTLCHVCSVMDFKKKGTTIEGFNVYLNTHYLKDGQFKGMSYSEYLGSAYKGDVDEVENMNIGGESSDNVINTDSTYATIFVYAKGENDIREFLRTTANPTPVGGQPGAIIGGGVFGAAVLGIGGAVFCFVTGGAGCILTGAILGAAGGVAGAADSIAVSDDVGWVAVSVIKPYDAESLRALGCEELPVKQDLHNDKLG